MENATPMLRQYLEIKKLYPGTLLFFRLGDFYEMFNEDAILGSRELQITLNRPPQRFPKSDPDVRRAAPRSGKLYCAACKKRLSRGDLRADRASREKVRKLVKREVVRVITPGTAIDPQLVEASDSIYLAAVCGGEENVAVAFLELSTGEFTATEVSGSDAWRRIQEIVQSYSPREILFPEELARLIRSNFSRSTIAGEILPGFLPANSNSSPSDFTLTPLDDRHFDLKDCENLLTGRFEVKELTAFGLSQRPEAVRAAGSCSEVCVRHAKSACRSHISEINYFETIDFLVLDAVTLRNLEIVESRE